VLERHNEEDQPEGLAQLEFDPVPISEEQTSVGDDEADSPVEELEKHQILGYSERLWHRKCGAVQKIGTHRDGNVPHINAGVHFPPAF